VSAETGRRAAPGPSFAVPAAARRPKGAAAARAIPWPRYFAFLLPALLVFSSETVRHEYLHGDVPLMLGNIITGATALVITLAILLPLYRRLDAADARVRRLEIEQAVADERERIARELHDGISQALFFLNVQAGTLQRSLRSLAPSPGSDGALGTVREIEAAVKDMAQRVREAIFDLRTGRRPDQPFAEWLRTYARRWSDVHDIAVTVEEAGPSLALPLDRELHVMAAVREALHNVAKHAHAKTVAITVTTGDSGAELTVADDGRGLPDPVPGLAEGRYGLATLREEAQAAGGTLRAERAPGGGTHILLSLPRTAPPR
jgi:signal transduction histidine kinase